MPLSSISPSILLQFIIYYTPTPVEKRVYKLINAETFLLHYCSFMHSLFGYIRLPQLPTFVDFSRVNLANTCRQESYYICAKNANTNIPSCDSSLCTSTTITATTTLAHSSTFTHNKLQMKKEKKRGTERITFEEVVGESGRPWCEKLNLLCILHNNTDTDRIQVCLSILYFTYE